MICIGLGVEGPSDQAFWNKFLHRHFAGTVRFQISVMHGRTKLMNGASRLLAAFASANCSAVFLLVDKDKDPCMTAVYDEFPNEFRARLKNHTGEPICRLCVADKELESWFLAEECAMSEALGLANYTSTTGGGKIGGKGKLEKLLIEHTSRGAAFNEIAIAKQFGALFRPENAVKNSASFAYFWDKLNEAIAAAKRKHDE